MIVVLRIGHRRIRDQRISTHCGLVARALGADGIIYSGERDENLVKSVNAVTKRWGGPFSASFEENWRKVVKKYKSGGFAIVHLTVYGKNFLEKMPEIKRNKKILLIVGSEKVPAEIYELANYNISVTNQPHSEIAALSLFMYELLGSASIEKKFKNMKFRVVGSDKGKNVLEIG